MPWPATVHKGESRAFCSRILRDQRLAAKVTFPLSSAPWVFTCPPRRNAVVALPPRGGCVLSGNRPATVFAISSRNILLISFMRKPVLTLTFWPAFRPRESLRLFRLPLRHLSLFGMDVRLVRHLVCHFSVAMGPCKTAADPEVSLNDGLAAHREGHVRYLLSGSKSYAEPKPTVLGFSKGCMEFM